MQRYTTNTILLMAMTLAACRSDIMRFDASGTFEATEIIVSAEVPGRIVSFGPQEGALLQAGEEIVVIDVSNLMLQKDEIEASIRAVDLKKADADPEVDILQQRLISTDAQIKTLKTQLSTLMTEHDRIHRMFDAGAATEQQRDQIDGQVRVKEQQVAAAETNLAVIRTQITSARRSVAVRNRGITSELEPMQIRQALIEDQLSKGTVINPVRGTLLTKYAHAGEFIGVGKPLYKVADLRTMVLRAYVDGTQLSQLKLNQEVHVYIDQGADDYRTYAGKITWISDQAEFTPKTIQTKDERANLVYAVKISVVNDGQLKIGMYGEVDLSSD